MIENKLLKIIFISWTLSIPNEIELNKILKSKRNKMHLDISYDLKRIALLCN